MAKRISRRHFLRLTGTSVVAGLVASACRRLPASTPPPTSTPTPTIIPTAGCDDPSVCCRWVPVRGERYEVQAPDTLDLQERAKLVISAMTSCTDPQDNFAPYDNFTLWRNPPIMYSKTMYNGKYMEASALLRYLTGSDLNQHVDEKWQSMFLREIVEHDYAWWGIDGGRLLAWLGIHYRHEKNPCWQELGEKAVARLSQEMVFVDDYCYYPAHNSSSSPATSGTMPTGWEATFQGWTLQGLTELHSATGSLAARNLASKLARYLKDHAQVFDEEGRFLARHPSDKGPALHFHHNGNALVGISEYALATGDEEYAVFAQSGYEWARSIGSPLVGFFPEYINDWPDDRPYLDCETCCTADMLELAMTLSQSGYGDYWDDVDRYVRNQFAEMQLTSSGWVDQMVATLPPTTVEAGEDGDRVSERIVGSFASWASANDWYIEGTPGTTFCCIGNGGRALYYVWEKMIGLKDGTLSIHLLLNRASPWADVSSYLPYEGRVDVVMKTGQDVEIRIPEWVTPGEVSCLVDGMARELAFRSRYAQVGHVGAGSRITVSLPIYERTVDTVIGSVPYTLIIKGNDVVSIDPAGKWYPFYQRAHYRESQARWVKRERFVPAM